MLRTSSSSLFCFIFPSKPISPPNPPPLNRPESAESISTINSPNPLTFSAPLLLPPPPPKASSTAFQYVSSSCSPIDGLLCSFKLMVKVSRDFVMKPDSQRWQTNKECISFKNT
ncbi:ORF363 [White spot syndrome virus]|uniref:Wsv330 n=3 Tax=White spot syndrome virus TaxID=342409 RepID=Q8VAR6_WSSVS|nr:wsv330 [Shrimp white spot syndrome virus]AFX59707.1 wsv330 [White spot syndrome virus]AAL33332.1 wsv330 [Shrimp white spot syndrome virus]AAL89254.1 WSSV386 [Shrimp white spot syndrome virus]ATU83586.1 ORF363 [White spot syndrome virus]AWQ60461.1 wsv330 [Shrimp white spot syndrome virus]